METPHDENDKSTQRAIVTSRQSLGGANNNETRRNTKMTRDSHSNDDVDSTTGAVGNNQKEPRKQTTMVRDDDEPQEKRHEKDTAAAATQSADNPNVATTGVVATTATAQSLQEKDNGAEITTMELTLIHEESGTHHGTYHGMTKNGKANGHGTWKIHEVHDIFCKEYVGDWKDNKPHGHGISHTADGGRYEGEVQEGKIHGTGRVYTANGELVYDGNWKEDKRHGHGVSYYVDEDFPEDFIHGADSNHRTIGDLCYDGEWKEGKMNGYGVLYSVDGLRYEGEFQDDNQHGKGKFYMAKLYKAKGELYYDGEWKDGKMHGHGVFSFADGQRYEGEFQDNKIHGTGRYYLAEGELYYDGEWKDGKMHGLGVVMYSSGDRYEGEWQGFKKHGQGQHYLPNGDLFYDGGWKEDKMHGHGVMRFLNGNRYEGEFHEGMRHGKGKGHMKNWHGDFFYDGDWKKDNRHGQGIAKYMNGTQYDGEWKGDKKHGNGVFHYVGGDQYKGGWQENKKHGPGVYHFASGDRFEGVFMNDKGHGTYYLPEGSYHGTWKDGKKASLFQHWVQHTNEGIETTKVQQFELATQLYQEVVDDGVGHDSTAAERAILLDQMVSNTPVELDKIISWTGINVGWFRSVFCTSPYMKKIIEFGCQAWFVRKVCVVELIRRNRRDGKGTFDPMSGPLVDHIESIFNGLVFTNHDGKETPITSKPTTFISYTGANTLDSMSQSLEGISDDEYIWLDIFCVDQFAWTGKRRTPEMAEFIESFADGLQSNIAAIGSTALLVEDWEEIQLTLEKMWVLWEIHNTVQAKASLNVLLTSRQRQTFISQCLESEEKFGSIQATLESIDANNAVTDDNLDRQVILERMQQVDRKLLKVNSSVQDTLRAWLTNEGFRQYTLQERVEAPPTGFLTRLGFLMITVGRLADAETVLQTALAEQRNKTRNFGLTRFPCFGMAETSGELVASLCVLGELLRKQGRPDEAEPLLQDVVTLFEQGDAPIPPSIAAFWGLLLIDRGKVDAAEPYLRKSLEGLCQAYGGRTEQTLPYVADLGLCLDHLGRFNEAETLCKELLETIQQVPRDRNTGIIKPARDLAELYLKQPGLPNLEKARELLLLSTQVSCERLGPSHPTTLSSVGQLAFSIIKPWDDKDHLEQAMDSYRQVLDVLQDSTVRDRPEHAMLLHGIAAAQMKFGCHDEALALLQRAHSVFSRPKWDDEHLLVEFEAALKLCKEDIRARIRQCKEALSAKAVSSSSLARWFQRKFPFFVRHRIKSRRRLSEMR